MCTVTVVPTSSGFRLACNRDERLDRPIGLSPALHSLRGVLALFPVDPVGGGTWAGVNDSALAVAVLNRTVPGDSAARPTLRRSRGVLGTTALEAERLAAAIRCVLALPPDGFDPFTLLMVQGDGMAVVAGDGRRFSVKTRELTGPALVTSSSLGDSLVDGPRRALFHALVCGASSPCDGQTAYHRHRWPDRPEISVDMRRIDAATVSRTWIEVGENRTTLRYERLAADTRSVTPGSTGGQASRDLSLAS